MSSRARTSFSSLQVHHSTRISCSFRPEATLRLALAFSFIMLLLLWWPLLIIRSLTELTSSYIRIVIHSSESHSRMRQLQLKQHNCERHIVVYVIRFLKCPTSNTCEITCQEQNYLVHMSNTDDPRSLLFKCSFGRCSVLSCPVFIWVIRTDASVF